MAFIFYDAETTGTDTTFDQILQFAAILTDDDFRELDRFEIRCRLLPHVVPAPGALLATRVTPEMLTDPGLPTHYQAMRQIRARLVAWSPAVFIGYNTLAFDEPLLRQGFHQTLHPVYLTNTKGNRRADVIRLAQAAAVLTPNAIVVPINHNGRPTLRLDMLAPANGFAHENAHDALADVEATIFMARRIRDRAPAVWAALIPLAAKDAVIARALSFEPQCLVEYHYGRPTARAVVGCGQSADNPGMLGVFDLAHDPTPYLELASDEIAAQMAGPGRSIRIVYANKMPALAPLSLASDPEAEFGASADLIRSRAARVAGALRFQERVAEALAGRYPPRETSRIVEERIHDGFPSRADERRIAAFHAAAWENRLAIVDTFEDDRLREIGLRLIHLEDPGRLPAELRARLEAWRELRREGDDGTPLWRTTPKALEEIDEILTSAPERADEIAIIEDWLRGQYPTRRP